MAFPQPASRGSSRRGRVPANPSSRSSPAYGGLARSVRRPGNSSTKQTPSATRGVAGRSGAAGDGGDSGTRRRLAGPPLTSSAPRSARATSRPRSARRAARGHGRPRPARATGTDLLRRRGRARAGRGAGRAVWRRRAARLRAGRPGGPAAVPLRARGPRDAAGRHLDQGLAPRLPLAAAPRPGLRRAGERHRVRLGGGRPRVGRARDQGRHGHGRQLLLQRTHGPRQRCLAPLPPRRPAGVQGAHRDGGLDGGQLHGRLARPLRAGVPGPEPHRRRLRPRRGQVLRPRHRVDQGGLLRQHLRLRGLQELPRGRDPQVVHLPLEFELPGPDPTSDGQRVVGCSPPCVVRMLGATPGPRAQPARAPPVRRGGGLGRGAIPQGGRIRVRLAVRLQGEAARCHQGHLHLRQRSQRDPGHDRGRRQRRRQGARVRRRRVARRRPRGSLATLLGNWLGSQRRLKRGLAINFLILDRFRVLRPFPTSPLT